jgi:nucleoside-diphosphate-sugar epimerase
VGRVLITGGSGFIGSHLAERLEESGDSVALFDLGFNSNVRNLNGQRIRGDVRDYGAVKEAIEGVDAVFHLAAVSRVAWGQRDPHTCWLTNVMGTVNVLEACGRSGSRPLLFYASSREVYGEPQRVPVKEDAWGNPVSIYGMTKLSAERACKTYLASSGLGNPVNYVIFRFSNVYGSERDLPERVIPNFMAKALRGEDITLFGGDQILDFMFVDDTVNGILKAYRAAMDGRSDLFGQAFHFVTGRGVSVSQLARLIIKATDSSSRILRSLSQDFDVRRFVGDPAKSREVLGFTSAVPLERGLEILRERLLGSSGNAAALATRRPAVHGKDVAA